jgi:hypothetical protein
MIRLLLRRRIAVRTVMTEVALIGWLASAVACVYWQWFDGETVYYNEHIVAESPVPRGGTLVLHSDFCIRGRLVPGSVVRSISNDFVYVLADNGAVIEPGCYSVRREVTLPEALRPGPHTYNFQAQFKINPIKTVVGKIKPVPFTVVP